MRTKRKPRPTQKVSVCILAEHPLAAELCQSALYKLLGKSIPPFGTRDMADPAAEIPSASTYIIDRNEHAIFLAPKILQSYPRARILAIDYAWSDDAVIRLLRMGVRGVLTYDQAKVQLVRAIQTVATDGYWVKKSTLSKVIQSVVDRTASVRVSAQGLSSSLTNREQQVLPLVSSGQTNKEIAAHLNISERTAKYYVEQLLRKFGVPNRAALMLKSAGLYTRID